MQAMFPHFASTDKRDVDPAGGSALTLLLDVALLGAVLAFAWRHCSAKHRHRRHATSARAPRAVHTWEGEGGRPLPAEHEASGVQPGAR
jgi:hypothetical protein